jgi:hypothetical protein
MLPSSTLLTKLCISTFVVNTIDDSKSTDYRRRGDIEPDKSTYIGFEILIFRNYVTLISKLPTQDVITWRRLSRGIVIIRSVIKRITILIYYKKKVLVLG